MSRASKFHCWELDLLGLRDLQAYYHVYFPSEHIKSSRHQDVPEARHCSDCSVDGESSLWGNNRV